MHACHVPMLHTLPSPYSGPLSTGLLLCRHTHRCSGVIHHGGVGTTGAGLRSGKPTLVVPFFGDLYLWGDVVARLGVGPAAVPVEHLSVERLLPALRVLRDRRVGGVAPVCCAGLCAVS